MNEGTPEPTAFCVMCSRKHYGAWMDRYEQGGSRRSGMTTFGFVLTALGR